MDKLPIPRFNLKAPNAKKETLIFLVYRYHGKRVLYSTGLNIHPKDWDFNSQRPIEKVRRPDLWTLQRQLNDISAYCKSIFIESNYGNITPADFKEQLDIKIDKSVLVPIEPIEPPNPEKKRPTFLEFLDLEIEEMKRTNPKKDTVRMFKNHVDIIKKFSKEQGPFTYEDVDWNLRLKFIDWLSGREVLLAYGNKTLNIFRQFLERARRKNLHSNTQYQGMGWSVAPKKAKGQSVTLNPDELQSLAELRLFGLAEKVRDLFLIGAGTGQRFSDYCRYTPDHFYTTINGATILSIISKKTDTPAKIPLNIFPWLIPTLEKYNYHSPKVSMQKFNEHIKSICHKAKLDSKILKVEQFIGRKPIVKKDYTLKYEEISSHTCRRSFATNLYRMGFRLSQIMPMTGHSTETQLRDYIGIDREENAENIALEIMRQQGKDPALGRRNLSVVAG